MDRLLYLEAALLAYVIVVAAVLLRWNHHAGGLVEMWYEEYVRADGTTSGSGKWRGENHAFQMAALLWGTWVYPFSVAIIILLIRRAGRTHGYARKFACLVCAAAAAYVLYRFHVLGMMRAVWSF